MALLRDSSRVGPFGDSGGGGGGRGGGGGSALGLHDAGLKKRMLPDEFGKARRGVTNASRSDCSSVSDNEDASRNSNERRSRLGSTENARGRAVASGRVAIGEDETHDYERPRRESRHVFPFRLAALFAQRPSSPISNASSSRTFSHPIEISSRKSTCVRFKRQARELLVCPRTRRLPVTRDGIHHRRPPGVRRASRRDAPRLQAPTRRARARSREIAPRHRIGAEGGRSPQRGRARRLQEPRGARGGRGRDRDRARGVSAHGAEARPAVDVGAHDYYLETMEAAACDPPASRRSRRRARRPPA